MTRFKNELQLSASYTIFLKEKQTRFAAQNVRVICLTKTNAVDLPSSASDASSLGQNLSLTPPPVIRDVQANMFLFSRLVFSYSNNINNVICQMRRRKIHCAANRVSYN